MGNKSILDEISLSQVFTCYTKGDDSFFMHAPSGLNIIINLKEMAKSPTINPTIFLQLSDDLGDKLRGEFWVDQEKGGCFRTHEDGRFLLIRTDDNAKISKICSSKSIIYFHKSPNGLCYFIIPIVS